MAVADAFPSIDAAPALRRSRARREAALSADQVAVAVDQLRAQVIAEKRRAFPSLPPTELEDLYSEASIGALRGRFADVPALRAYVRLHVHNRATTLKQSPYHARRLGTGSAVRSVAADRPDGAPGPHERAVQGELIALLYEFLAEQSPVDRNVAWLLANGCRPAQIARRLGIPRAQATADCKRLRSSLERFVALQTRPAAICARRRVDVLTWQETGRMPLALRWHLRWHHGCGLAVRDAREAVQHALLPLVPAAAALPRVGLVQRAWQAIAGHRVTTTVHDALLRVRRLAPAGGGSAAAGAGAIKAVAIIGVGAAAVHAVAAGPAHHPHHARPRIVAHATSDVTTTPVSTVPAVSTTPTPLPQPATSTVSTTSTTTTTSSTATAPAAPDSGASTPPATAAPGASSSAPSTSTDAAAPTEAPASPTGATVQQGGGGGGQGASSGVGGGSTPP